MTDVAFGGATVFPKLGVAVQPSQGAAIIWNNVDEKDGSAIWESIHGKFIKYVTQNWRVVPSLSQKGEIRKFKFGVNSDLHFDLKGYRKASKC